MQHFIILFFFLVWTFKCSCVQAIVTSLVVSVAFTSNCVYKNHKPVCIGELAAATLQILGFIRFYLYNLQIFCRCHCNADEWANDFEHCEQL